MLQDYFKEKNILCDIVEEATPFFTSYKIILKDIKDLKKFNNAMLKELTYYLHDASLQLIIDDDIKIITKNKSNGYNNDCLNEVNTTESLTIDAGITADNKKVIIDMKNNPHWLVSGSTGSGKSVFMNNIITYILKNYHYKVSTCFIDLKKVEFYQYNNLKTNIFNVANEYDQAIDILNKLICIMNARYQTLQDKGYKNIQDYNANEPYKMKYIFCFIDELAELILYNKKEVQTLLCRLLQLGRAAGIHLIVATQRPSTDVISGLLKNNFTTKISFKVSNMFDSKTILNQAGAEKLAGNGDGLILKNGDFKTSRFQAYNIDPLITKAIIDQLRGQTVQVNGNIQGTFKSLVNKLKSYINM